MRLLPQYSALLACLSASTCAWNHVSESSFREELAGNDISLVAFVAPTTDASQKLESEWATVQASDSSALSVDCLAETKLCAELDVVSFPAIRLYRKDGGMRRYRGPRKANLIQAFQKRLARPAISELDEKAVQDFVTSDQVVFIAQLSEGDDDGTKLEERFADLAARNRDRFSFGTLRASSPGKKSGVTCYNNVDTVKHGTADLLAVESLDEFVDKCATPLVPEMTRRNEMDSLASGKSIVYYFSPDDQDRQSYVANARPLARKYAQFLTFVTVDSGAYPEMVSGLGVPGGGAGVGLSVSNPQAGQIFPFQGPKEDQTKPEALETFIVAISEGKVQPWDGTPGAGEAAEAEDHDEL